MKLPMTIAALDPNIPLKKHTGTVHIEANFNTMERKMINILYKSAFDAQNWQSDFFYIRTSDIRFFLDREKIHKYELENCLKKLRTAAISWNIFGQDNKNKEQWEKLATGETGFISGWLLLEDGNGNCNGIQFSLSPEIKNMIRDPNIYTYIDLQIQKKLNSKYEMVLYELLADELNRSRSNSTVTRYYSIGDLFRIFCISPTSYLSEFKFFNKYCIKEPMNILNKCSDLTVEINETIKINKKIVAYSFKIAKKTETKESIQEEIKFTENVSKDSETEENVSYNEYEVFEELSQLFNNQDTATKIINHVKEKYNYFDYKLLITANIEYAKRIYTKKEQQNTNKIENFLGFLRMAVENDWAGFEIKFQKEIQAEQLAEQEKLRIEEEKRLTEIKRQQEQEENERIEMENKEKRASKLRSYGLIEHVELLDFLKKDLGETIFETWFHKSQLFMDTEKYLYIITPNDFSTDYIREHFSEQIKNILSKNNVEIISLRIMSNISKIIV
jgi:hypothetical protein